MSNEPVVKRLSAPPAQAPADTAAERDADAARMAAAFERMEAAIGGRPDSIDRLRTDLAELADAIAQARIAADAAARLHGDVDARLQDIAARTRRIIERAGPAPEPVARPADEQQFLDAMQGPQAEPDRVPTVSGVVSQLGREDGAETTIEPAAGARDVTTVSMLEAMVEELTASMPAAKPPAATELRPATEAAAPRDPATPDVELLSSLARMKAMSFMLPEMGTAVIFEAKAKPATTGTETTQSGEPPAAVAQTPIAHEPIRPAGVAPPPPQPGSGDIDLDSLLFEPAPEPEPDPAAFLLEPAPWPAEAPPQPAPATEPAQASPTQPAIETAVRPQTSWTFELPGPAPVPAQHRPAPTADADPLGPLRAMSDEEKIALFE